MFTTQHYFNIKLIKFKRELQRRTHILLPLRFVSYFPIFFVLLI